MIVLKHQHNSEVTRDVKKVVHCQKTNGYYITLLLLGLFHQFSLPNQQGKLISLTHSDDKDATFKEDKKGNLFLKTIFPRIFLLLFHRDRGDRGPSRSDKDGVSDHRVVSPVSTLRKVTRGEESPARKSCQQQTDISDGLATHQLI